MQNCHQFVQLAHLLWLKEDTLIVQILQMFPLVALVTMKDYRTVLILACVAVMMY